MAAQTDRNLLFGALALQLEFISQDGLVKGINHWLLKKDQSLCDILVEQESLSAEHRQLLQQLVDAHGQIRAQRPEEIPAAPNLAMAGLAAALQQIDDEDLRQSLSVFSTSPDSSSPSLHRGLPPMGERFVNARPLAKGGLGEVSIALDRELNREVAFKQVRPEYAANGEASGRFRLEAEVTGRLEHPGIVPVYSFGTTIDGRPFYAMRLIRGESLHEAIRKFHTTSEEAEKKPAEVVTEDRSAGRSERRNSSASRESFSGLEFRQLLQRFIAVCQAVSYAHSRGVLHRDLKPANIMLGKYGETLVVDWGLAKAADREDIISTTDESVLQPRSGSGATPTMQGSAIGTPGYMSPEQAAGDVARMSPASDVYSLGATLYQVLTGTVPFHRSVRHQLLDDVRAGRWTPVREVLPEVPVPLAAICEKAMAFESSRRYSTPQELGDDIERFLADEPVSATVDPITIRLRRWIRRHQTIAVTSAAVVLVIAISTAIFSIVLSAKNDALVIANRREQEAKATAHTNARNARGQTQLALSTLSWVIWDVQKGLANVPGSSDVRRQLLKTSLERLKSVSTQYLSTPSQIDITSGDATPSIVEVAALIEMGNLIINFGDAPSAPDAELSDEGKTSIELAQSFFSRALSIGQELAQTGPENSELWAPLALAQKNLGQVLIRQNRTNDALRHLEAAHAVIVRIAEADARDLARQLDLADSHEALGTAFLHSGRIDKALRHYESMQVIASEMVSSNPEEHAYQERLAFSHERLGEAFMMFGRTADAIHQLEAKIRIVSKLAEGDPGNTQYPDSLSVTHNLLSGTFLRTGQFEDALVHAKSSVVISKKLADADSNNLRWQSNLSVAHIVMRDALLSNGQTKEAHTNVEEAVRIRKALAEKDPNDAEKQRDLFVAYSNLGDGLFDLGRLDEALLQYQKSFEGLRELAESDAEDEMDQRDLFVQISKTADVLLAMNRPMEAVEKYRQVLQRSLALSKAHPANTDFQHDLAISFEKLGNCHLRMNETDEAITQLKAAIGKSREMANAESQNLRKQAHLARLLLQVGDICLAANRPDEAIVQFQALADHWTLVVQNHPAESKKADLWLTFAKLGDAEAARSNFSASADHYAAAIKTLERILTSDENPSRFQQDLEVLKQQEVLVRMSGIAIGEWNAVLKQPPEELPAYLELRGILCCQRDRFGDAQQAARMLAKLPEATGDQLYNAGCVLSRCAAAVTAPDGTELTSEQASERGVLASESIATLKKAIEKGWSDFDHMAMDPDLATVRELPEFNALLPAERRIAPKTNPP